MYRSSEAPVPQEPATSQESSDQKKTSSRKFSWKSIRNFWIDFRLLVRIQEDTDREATISSIQKSVEFRGVNIWLLVFAILIASIGLNVNSTAVIIGAMLVSPLMGPINGIGLAIGTYDMQLLRKAFRNLLLMVGISLFVSTLYFLLSPLGEAQSELLARTRPTIYDVLIATVGGLAGITASSRRDLPFTVISGVAIATALMPPLCTVGYGIATWQLKFSAGAFYLFFINSFFIALSTFIMVRYLRFPRQKFLDKSREKMVKRIIVIISVIVVIPSLFMALNVVRETLFDTQVKKFVATIQDNGMIKNTQQLVSVDKDYDRKTPTLTLNFVGDEVLPTVIDSMRKMMRADFGLNTTELKVKQAGGVINAEMQAGQLGKMIADKDKEIKAKEEEIASLSVGSAQNRRISKRIGDDYAASISAVAVNTVNYYRTDSQSDVNIATVIITWKENADRAVVVADLNKMIPFMLQVDRIEIVSVN